MAQIKHTLDLHGGNHLGLVALASPFIRWRMQRQVA
jgi:hypothetical protein